MKRSWDNPPYRAHFVYLIATVVNGQFVSPVKVGITKDVAGRLRTIRTSSPRPVEVVHAFALPNKSVAEFFEQGFHYLEASSRSHGEWFDMDPCLALRRLLDCIVLHQQHEVPDHLKADWMRRTGFDEGADLLISMVGMEGVSCQ